MLPLSMVRALAAEAEAYAEARAKLITANGELKATKAMLQAAENIAENPVAVIVS